MRSIKCELLREQEGSFGDGDHVTLWKAEGILNSESVLGLVFLGNILLMFFVHWSEEKKEWP